MSRNKQTWEYKKALKRTMTYMFCHLMVKRTWSVSQWSKGMKFNHAIVLSLEHSTTVDVQKQKNMGIQEIVVVYHVRNSAIVDGQNGLNHAMVVVISVPSLE